MRATLYTSLSDISFGMHSIESLTERLERLNRTIASLENRTDAISRNQDGISGIGVAVAEKEKVASKPAASSVTSASTTTKNKFKAAVTAVVATTAFASSSSVATSTGVSSTYNHDEYVPVVS